MTTREANFDGIVGPTHNYAGLSPGNIASEANAGAESRPRDAALQGLAKAKRLADAGLDQYVLPPLARPDIAALRRIGEVDVAHVRGVARCVEQPLEGAVAKGTATATARATPPTDS